MSVTGDNKEFNKEFFDNENWYIRLLMEAEDRMAYSQSKISTNHGVFSNSDVTDDAEIMRGSSKDFVDDVIDREILNALIKELTERQKTVLNLVYFEEMIYRDAAEILKNTLETAEDPTALLNEDGTIPDTLRQQALSQALTQVLSEGTTVTREMP